MQGGGGPAEPVPYLVASDRTTKILSKKAEPAAERHPRLNPSKNLAKHVLDPSGWAMYSPYCHAELVSASVPCCELPVTLDRSRNKFGMTLKEIPSLRAVADRVAIAEILLSLTIIGVVAAITLPSLTGNINERTWNTQRKALYARFSQAIALMPALNGYGTLREITDSAGSTSIEDTAAETFVTAGLSKVLKINNICDNEHIDDCGFVNKIVTLNAITISTPATLSELNSRMLVGNSRPDIVGTFSIIDTKVAAFETANGESILTFYNPNCQASMNETNPYYVQPKVCANFIFDLNGNKGPNTVGKDIGFMTVFYPTDSSVVAPNVPVQKASQTATQQDALGICKEQDPEFRIPSQDELSSMFVNQLLMNGEIATGAVNYWSSKLRSSTVGWTQGFNTGARLNHLRSLETNVHCVKR